MVMDSRGDRTYKQIFRFLNGLLTESARMEGKPVICGTCAAVRTSAWEPCQRCGEVD